MRACTLWGPSSTSMSFSPSSPILTNKADGKFYWGRVTWEGEDKTLISIMPYLWDILVAMGVGVGVL